jgi:transmembrane sensor
MDEQVLRNLLDKYLTGTLTEAERVALSGLLQQPAYLGLLERILAEEFTQRRFEGEGHEEVLSLIQEHVGNEIKHAGKRKVLPLRKWAAAAAVVLLISGSYFVFFRRQAAVSPTQISENSKPILPGGN